MRFIYLGLSSIDFGACLISTQSGNTPSAIGFAIGAAGFGICFLLSK